VIRAVWTEPNPTYAGEFYSLNGAVCNPPPVQRPHPPLWIGGGDAAFLPAYAAALS
jgi:alkanesulfonate monooxygenase SsuD/methylene tetrahydromethanopterin reductase-like flavin-dependent oxidoreductase (luciferase family)